MKDLLNGRLLRPLLQALGPSGARIPAQCSRRMGAGV